MNLGELFAYTDWVDRELKPILPKFQQLHTVLKHNSTQPQKQPVTDPLEALQKALSEMKMKALSEDSRNVLNLSGTGNFVGKEGAQFTDETVRMGDFDPATAAERISQASNSVSNAISRPDQLKAALKDVSTDAIDPSIEEGKVEVRLRFTENATIKNVADLRRWSKDWYNTVHGIASCIGETPEDTKITGASRGSIWLYLVASSEAAKLIAIITVCAAFAAKHLMSVAK